MRPDRPVLVERFLVRLARGARHLDANALYSSLTIGALGTSVYFLMLVSGGSGHLFVGLLLGAWLVGAPLLGVVNLVWRDGRRALLGLLVGNAVFFVALCGAHLLGSEVIVWRIESWKRDGLEIASALEAHREQTGHFPRSLDELPSSTPRPPERWFKYWASDDSFEMTIHNPRSFLGWDGWQIHSGERAWTYFWD